MAAEPGGGCWSSTLTVEEFTAVRSVGYEPVGQVMGTSVSLIGYPARNCMSRKGIRTLSGKISLFADELVGVADHLEASLLLARTRAIARLDRETKALGGDGIVGVGLTVRTFPFNDACWQFQAIGTAVRAVRRRARGRGPFRSALTGQDFAVLLAAGYLPVDIVTGFGCVAGHLYPAQRKTMRRLAANGEIAGWTAVAHSARARARDHLLADVTARRGEGCVLASSRMRNRIRPCSSGKDFAAEVLLVGTAITPAPPAEHAPVATAPLTMLRLDRPGGWDTRDHAPLVEDLGADASR